jgi:hypothetical protein
MLFFFIVNFLLTSTSVLTNSKPHPANLTLKTPYRKPPMTLKINQKAAYDTYILADFSPSNEGWHWRKRTNRRKVTYEENFRKHSHN